MPQLAATSEVSNIETPNTFLSTLTSCLSLSIASAQNNQQELFLAKRETEQAKKLVQQKAEFLSQMSHEIRTPLAGIIGLVDMLIESSPTEKQSFLLNYAKSACDHLSDLLNSILDLSRIEAAKLELEEEEFNLKKEIKTVLDTLQGLAKGKNNQLILNYDEDIPTHLIGDCKHLRQVLLNICGNSLKFTDNGTIMTTITVGEKTAHYCQIDFEIRDTGSGIPENKLEKLFDIYSHTSQDLEKKSYQPSSGLGLYLCAEFVKLMGGSIHLTSKEAEGTTVTFSLPFLINTTQFTALDEAKVPLPQLSILLVEDIPLNQLVTKYQLERHGHSVEIASSGEEALKMFLNNDYDCILMDIQLPKLNGIEVARQIKRTKEKTTLLIALTANATVEDKHACLNAGFRYFLTKPLQYENLESIFKTTFVGSSPQTDLILA